MCRQRGSNSIGAIASTYNHITYVFGNNLSKVAAEFSGKNLDTHSQSIKFSSLGKGQGSADAHTFPRMPPAQQQFPNYAKGNQAWYQMSDQIQHHTYEAPYYHRPVVSPVEERWEDIPSEHGDSDRENRISSFTSGGLKVLCHEYTSTDVSSNPYD